MNEIVIAEYDQAKLQRVTVNGAPVSQELFERLDIPRYFNLLNPFTVTGKLIEQQSSTVFVAVDADFTTIFTDPTHETRQGFLKQLGFEVETLAGVSA